MGNPIVTKLGRLAVLGLGLAWLVGCGSAPLREPPQVEKDIRKVGRLYMAYAHDQRNDMGPATLDELKKYAESLDEKKLTSHDLTKAELATIFTSLRDNQPYGIVPKVTPFGAEAMADLRGKGKGPGRGANKGLTEATTIVPPKVIVYEKVGADGTHFVVFNNVEVREISDADFQQLVPNP
jgi:hypothetical protein